MRGNFFLKVMCSNLWSNLWHLTTLIYEWKGRWKKHLFSNQKFKTIYRNNTCIHTHRNYSIWLQKIQTIKYFNVHFKIIHSHILGLDCANIKPWRFILCSAQASPCCPNPEVLLNVSRNVTNTKPLIATGSFGDCDIELHLLWHNPCMRMNCLTAQKSLFNLSMQGRRRFIGWAEWGIRGFTWIHLVSQAHGNSRCSW